MGFCEHSRKKLHDSVDAILCGRIEPTRCAPCTSTPGPSRRPFGCPNIRTTRATKRRRWSSHASRLLYTPKKFGHSKKKMGISSLDAFFSDEDLEWEPRLSIRTDSPEKKRLFRLGWTRVFNFKLNKYEYVHKSGVIKGSIKKCYGWSRTNCGKRDCQSKSSELTLLLSGTLSGARSTHSESCFAVPDGAPHSIDDEDNIQVPGSSTFQQHDARKELVMDDIRILLDVVASVMNKT